MPPKRDKSRAGGSSRFAGDQGLASVPFNEEGKWSACLALVVGNRVEDLAHVQALVSAVKEGRRKLFTSLSREDLYTLVNQFGTSKSSLKGKDTPQFSEICEPCKQHIENEEEIPLPLLAKLIKFKLLDIKSQDIKRREADKKALDERAKSSKGKPDKRDASRSPAKTGRNATGKGKPVESPVTKAASKLKKRGEEDLSAKYINDEPDDGPEHYVIISGFYHPHLMTYLAEIGVNIDAVINVNSQTYNSTDAVCSNVVASGELSHVVLTDDAVVSDDDEQKRKEEEKISIELRKFWQDVLLIMDKAPENSSLHDVARLEYMVPDFAVPHATDDEAKTAFGAMVFEVVACLMYNLLDAKRQWRNYLENLRLVHVPLVRTAEAHEFAENGFASSVVSQSHTKLESALDFDGNAAFEVDMKRYNELMNCVPLESVGIPLIMHCMLEQISAYDQQLNANREASDDEKADGLENCLSQHLGTLAFKLALTAEERKVLFPDYNPQLSRTVDSDGKQPLLIHFHDDITRRLNHLEPVGSFNPVEAELQMLGYSLASKLTSRILSDSDSVVAQERAARFQELLFFCNKQGIYSKADIGHALRQFVLECMNLTVVDEDGRIYNPRGQQMDIPWDDPYPYYVGMIPTEKSPRVSSCKESTESLSQDQDLVIESSREQLSSSGSILKRPESRNSRKRASSCQSVRFEEDDSGQRTSRPGDENPEEENECSENSGSTNRNSSLSFDSKVDASEVVNDNSKRNLDNWQYAEHMEPKILLQALAEALQTHPCVDTYYQKRDDTLLVVFHNPHSPEISNSFKDWHVALHSNVRFRNYLEFVADRIVEWTESEEAKYEARLLAQEVQRLQNEDENQMAPVDKKRPARSKSPKKAGTPDNRTPRSPSSSIEREMPHGTFIRAGSLKAWKEEQARLKEEEEEREQLAEEKRVKSSSSQKKLRKDVAPENSKSKEKDKEKGSKKKQLDSKPDEKSELVNQESTTAAEKYWPFTGYDVGNKVIHLAGITSSLFPDDGSQILTERIQYLHGTTSVRATVRKSGHSFAVHVIDPKKMIESSDEVEKMTSPEAVNVEEKEEEGVMDRTPETTLREKPEMDENVTEGHSRAVEVPQSTEHIGVVSSSREKHQQDNPAIGRFGSFTAQFSDGMTLSMSCFGPAGEPPNGKPYEPDPYSVAMNAPATGGRAEREASPGKRTKAAEKANKEKDKPSQADTLQAPTENETEEVTEDVPALPECFQQLYVTCPDGLSVTYSLESSFGANSVSDKKQIVVKQSYPFKVKSRQKCEGARKTAMQEQSRLITSDGTVIKTMLDGSAKVLFADGTVSEFCFSSSLIQVPLTNISDPHQVVRDSVSSATKKKIKHRSPKGNQQGSAASPEEDLRDKGFWITTLPSGKRTASHVNGASVKVPDAVVYVATDPQTLQVMHTRDDHVVTVHHPDGLTIVEHSDGTRITTKRQELLQEEVSEKNIDNDGMENTEQVIKACIVRNKDDVELDQEILLPEAKDNTERDVQCDSNEDLKRETEKSSTTDEKLLTTKFVLVECPGYASVRFDEASGLCSCEFGNGCIVDCMTEGRYDVFHQTGSCLRLDSDGTAVFYDERESCAPRDGHEPQYYVMRHFDSVIAETIDGRGAHYIVTNFGENHVNLPNAESESETRDGSTEVESDQRPHSAQSSGVGLSQEQNVIKKISVIPVPRMFAINSDGSGVELLHSNDISSYLSKVEKDPTSVVLTAPLPDSTDVYGITVLRPVLKNMSQSWMKGYLSDSIIPAGLRSRDLQRISPGRVETQNTKGIDGSGRRAVAKAGSVHTQSKKKVKCPPILEFRQLIKRNSMSDTLRNQLTSALKSYADHAKKRATYYNEISRVEAQSDAEKEHTEVHQAQLSTRCVTPLTLASDQDVKSIYEKALTPVERPTVTASAKARKKKYDLELVRQELAEEKECLLALRLRNISPYFKSNMSCSYFNRQDKTKKVNLQKQFVGYMACGESLKADEIESSEYSNPPPGMVCQHVSPEPDDRHMEVEVENDKADDKLPNADDNLMALTTEQSLQEECQPTDDKTVNLCGQSAKEPFMSNVCLASEELINTNTLQESESSKVDGKNPEETERSLNEGHLESRSSSCVQSSAELLEDNKATNALVVSNSAEEMNNLLLETLDSHRRIGCDDFKKQNETSQCVAEEPMVAISKDDPFLVTTASEDMQNDHRSSQQIGYDQLTVHMDRSSDGNLYQGEAVVKKSENSKLGSNVSYVIRRTQAECSHCDTPCLPGYVSNGKRPGAFPNMKFACIEDPIRRKVNNVVITGATPAGFQAISHMRGLEVVPERVDFGILKEGNTYTYNLILKNTGVDACRFRIKQPPPSTGVKILYKPGPVAAGMKTDVQVEIYAIAVGVEGDRGVGLIAHNVEITTETDHILLPVTATVLTANEFECRGPGSPQGQKAPGVRLTSSKPPAGVGLIRPRKNLMHGGCLTVN